jgi:antibiotic biosynthesis monooxygenase (ABM) superfamily enzyme
VARVAEFTEGEARIERIGGLEFWFTPPKGASTLPRWKMALVSGLVLWPLNSLLSLLLYPLIGAWPIPVRALIIAGLLVPVMTYFAMPWATRLFSKWLYPGQK